MLKIAVSGGLDLCLKPFLDLWSCAGTYVDAHKASESVHLTLECLIDSDVERQLGAGHWHRHSSFQTFTHRTHFSYYRVKQLTYLMFKNSKALVKDEKKLGVASWYPAGMICLSFCVVTSAHFYGLNKRLK